MRQARTYVYGSAARQLQYRETVDPELRRQREHRARKIRDKASYMNPYYSFFVVAVIGIIAFFVIQYVSIQAQITASINNISTLEKRLNSLKHSNDEEYSRVENSVSLDDVKRIAVEQLGMKYATEDQVVEYMAADADYVRQNAEIEQD